MSTVERLRAEMLAAFQRHVHRALQFRARLFPILQQQEISEMAIDSSVTSASEALVAVPLPSMLAGLGLAVAEANKKMSELKDTPNNVVMTVQKATIELNIAISLEKSEKVAGEVELGFKAFSVNASYARTFNFKEEASSKITMELAIVPAKQI